MEILQSETITGLGAFFWWEKRRLLYNLIMLITGIASHLMGFIGPAKICFWIAINLNVLYTLSWVIQLVFTNQFSSRKLINIYTTAFFVGFLAYSMLCVLLFSKEPELIDWSFYPYQKH